MKEAQPTAGLFHENLIRLRLNGSTGRFSLTGTGRHSRHSIPSGIRASGGTNAAPASGGAVGRLQAGYAASSVIAQNRFYAGKEGLPQARQCGRIIREVFQWPECSETSIPSRQSTCPRLFERRLLHVQDNERVIGTSYVTFLRSEIPHETTLIPRTIPL